MRFAIGQCDYDGAKGAHRRRTAKSINPKSDRVLEAGQLLTSAVKRKSGACADSCVTSGRVAGTTTSCTNLVLGFRRHCSVYDLVVGFQRRMLEQSWRQVFGWMPSPALLRISTALYPWHAINSPDNLNLATANQQPSPLRTYLVQL